MSRSNAAGLRGCLLILAGLLLAGGLNRDYPPPRPASAGLEMSAERAAELFASFEAAFARAADAIAPAVVSITARRAVPAVPKLPPPLDELLKEDESGAPPRSQQQEALGSGLVVDPRGYILTNYHVVAGAEELTVQLADRRLCRATLVGSDPRSDLALVQVDAGRLPAAELADSGSVDVGRWVLAIGSPFGLSRTVTFGIVSAKGRGGIGVADYEDLIQTDAAINAGNSGGPLLNLRGEVVGINTAILSRSGGSQGVGFAIPSNMARRILRDLLEQRKVTRGWLGVTLQDLTPELAAAFQYEQLDGVLVGDVHAGSPAEQGGMRAGDIVSAVEGRLVPDLAAFRNRIAEARPGTAVQLSLWRDAGRLRLSVQLGQMPDDDPPPVVLAPAPVALVPGIELADLHAEARPRHGVAVGEGVLVVRVLPNSAAERAGLRSGDVITSIQDERVSAAEAARGLLADDALQRGVRLRVRSGGSYRFAVLKTSP